MTLLVIVFVVTMALCAGTYLIVTKALQQRDSKKVVQRISPPPGRTAQKSPSGAPLFLPEDRKGPSLLNRALTKFNVDRQLQSLIEQAGLSWAPGQVVAGSLLLALIAFNVCWYAAEPMIQNAAFVAAPLAASLPLMYLRRRRTRRVRAFEAQLPDSLQFISRAMRAGHAFSVSLEMLHKEFPEPLGGEFRRTFEEQNLGLPIDVALQKLARRVPLIDVQFFVAAVLLQKRTGGNLAEILDKLATIIRERFKLRGQIRSISAHGRLSSLVLTAIPAVVAVMMYFVNRDHMLYFVEDEMGQWMAGLAIGFQALGYLVMRQIVKIEV